MSDADKKIKIQFLQSAKSRMILALALIVIVVAAVVFVVHWRSTVASNVAAAGVAGAPSIASTPGAGSPSAAYVQAQTKANVSGEIEARKSATSFVPTITRSGFVGNPNEFGQGASSQSASSTDANAPSPQCPVNKVVMTYKPNPASCTPNNLKLARETGVTAEELLCQGCSCPALKSVGYTVGELKQIGLSAAQLRECGFSVQALINAGFNATELKAAGFSAAELKNGGFTAGELRDAGFSAADLKNVGYAASQLKNAGFSAADLKAVGFDATALKDAGFSAADLKAAGFSAADLKNVGYTASQLKNAGFSVVDLKKAGFNDADLKAAGFSPSAIASDIGLKGTEPQSADCNLAKLKQERAAGVSATELHQRGCGLTALKAVGFSAGALSTAGFSAADLKAVGFDAKALKDAGFSAADLKATGFSANELKDAGFSAADLKAAGFNAGELKDAGFTAGQLVSAGFSPIQLKNAGFSATQLKNAGFSAADLKAVGFSVGQLVSAGFGADALKAVGFTAAQLHTAGMSASALRAAGFSAADLKTAGFTRGDLLRAGFSTAEPAAVSSTEVAPTTGPSSTASLLPSINANSPEAKLAQFEKQQQAEMSQQQRQDHIERLQAMMTQQANTFMAGWSNAPNQELQKAPATASAASGGVAGSTSAAALAKATNRGPVIKAGSVLFAVIQTSINSDENTPIMAHIVTGELNGSKLLGTFSRQHKRLLISFSVLSDPRYPNSIPINAVAIDPDTARTAISGQVNSHYLLRYGSLFASSFLQGVGEGIANQGVTSNCLVAGFGCTVSQTALTSRQQVMVGFGKVGQAYAQHMGSNFTVPPTVRIPAGTGIGVLIMGDLNLPTNPSGKG